MFRQCNQLTRLSQRNASSGRFGRFSVLPIVGGTWICWTVGTHYALTETDDGSFFPKGRNDKYDTLFADRLGESPWRTVARSFGFGSDWMTQLPLETRMKWEEWPWADWWRFTMKVGVWGPRIEHGEFDVHDTHNPMLIKADICPDCCRVSLIILCFLAYLNQRVMRRLRPDWYHVFSILLAMFFYATISALGGVGLLDKVYQLLMPGFSGVLESGMLPQDYTDLDYVAYRTQLIRTGVLEGLEDNLRRFYQSNYIIADMLEYREKELTLYQHSMDEVDEHVRLMSIERKIKLNLATPMGRELWEYGRDFGEAEIVDTCRRLLPSTHQLQVPLTRRQSSQLMSDNDDKLSAEQIELEKFRAELAAEFGTKSS